MPKRADMAGGVPPAGAPSPAPPSPFPLFLPFASAMVFIFALAFGRVMNHTHPCLMPAELDHLVHLQAARQLMRDEEHGDSAFELVDGPRKLLRRRLIEAAGGLVEDEDLRALQ